MSSYQPAVSREDCAERLRKIFPREAFDPAAANKLGASAVSAMIYVGAVVPDETPTEEDATWCRPTSVLWMSDEVVLIRDEPESRAAWLSAALRGKGAVQKLLAQWGMTFRPWYQDNTREPLRDETFTAWLDHGAIRYRPGIPRNSPVPIWALAENFARLFLPELTGALLDEAIEAWRQKHMSPGDRFRIRTLQERERKSKSVVVSLPGGEVRSLEPGPTSLILKGILERWVPARLSDPVVLTISEPGDKIYIGDAAVLADLGIKMDTQELLPDAVIVDIGTSPPLFWIVEAVHTDGPVTEDRRRQLVRWADNQHIPIRSCRFLSAFKSRHDSAARKRLKDLAVNTFAWYADEPAHELAWYEIPELPD
ncbi:MAG: BsuBI/PstI family type II restriction endonuclease [Pseudonocardiaceae bacterium]